MSAVIRNVDEFSPLLFGVTAKPMVQVGGLKNPGKHQQRGNNPEMTTAMPDACFLVRACTYVFECSVFLSFGLFALLNFCSRR